MKLCKRILEAILVLLSANKMIKEKIFVNEDNDSLMHILL